MSSSPPPAEPPARVTVHTSWRGLVTAVLSPMLLIGFGVLVTVAGGGGPVAALLIGLGSVLAGITLLDYPRRVEFTPAGIARVGFVRTQHLPWSDVVAIERTPPTARSALRRRGPAGPGAEDGGTRVGRDGVSGARVSGGLVARGPGRRRYLLTDRVEGPLEFDALAGLLRDLDVATNLRAGRPGPDTPPSDLYRRGTARRQDRP